MHHPSNTATLITVRHVLVGCLGFAASLLWLNMALGSAQTLTIDSQRGEVGSTVSFTVAIHNAPREVGAFSFEVAYDPQVLQYKKDGKVPGELLSRFVFDAVDRGDHVQVAGFSAKEIAAGSSGRMITLQFEVKQPGDTALTIENLGDHVAGWSVQSGFFEYVPSPPAEQTQDAQAAASQREDSASQPSSEAAEAVSPEAQPTLEEQLERQVQAILAETSNPTPTTSRSPTVPLRPIGIHNVTKPAETQQNTQAQATQEHRAPGPTGTQGVQSTPSTQGAVLSQPPPVDNTDRTEESVSAQALPQQQQPETGNGQAMQVTTRFIAQESATPSRQSADKRALVVPVDSETANRRAMPNPEKVSEPGFLSQTSRVVMLLVAVILLCVVSVVLIVLKTH